MVLPVGQNTREDVKPCAQKYSTLPKFGNSVRIAHPGSSLRGDHVVVIFASRVCGGRGSVARESLRAGRIALREPKASRGRTALKGSSRQQFFSSVDRAGEFCGEHGEPRVRQNRVVLAVVATAKLLRRRRSRQPARRR